MPFPACIPVILIGGTLVQKNEGFARNHRHTWRCTKCGEFHQSTSGYSFGAPWPVLFGEFYTAIRTNEQMLVYVIVLHHLDSLAYSKATPQKAESRFYMADEPSELVSYSGIYAVTHGGKHHNPHDVTCIEGRKFPPCSTCGDHPRFVLRLQSSFWPFQRPWEGWATTGQSVSHIVTSVSSIQIYEMGTRAVRPGQSHRPCRMRAISGVH